MTAIPACTDSENNKLNQIGKELITINSVAKDQSDDQKRKKITKGLKSTVLGAKRRFIQGVANGIDNLLEEGYNRDHATSLMLDQISRDYPRPNDKETTNKVFRFVKTYGVGFSEAVTALTVASALKQVQSERSLTPAEAIDELTKSISVNVLLQKHETKKPAQLPLSSETNPALPEAPGKTVNAQKGSSQSSTPSSQKRRSQSKPIFKSHKKTHNFVNNKSLSRRRGVKNEDMAISVNDNEEHSELKLKESVRNLTTGSQEEIARKRAHYATVEEEDIPRKRAKIC